MLPYRLSVCLWIVFMLGCGASDSTSVDSQSPPPLAKAPATGTANTSEPGDSPAASTTPKVVEIEGVNFTIPAGWKRADLMPAQAGIIAARYLIPVGDDELQLTFTTARGGIPANFERWKGQFELEPGTEPLEDRITLVRGDAYWLDLRGTFQSGSGISSGGSQDNIRMLGVGIPLADGEMYLKLMGQSSQVAKVSDALRDLVKSANLP